MSLRRNDWHRVRVRRVQLARVRGRVGRAHARHELRATHHLRMVWAVDALAVRTMRVVGVRGRGDVRVWMPLHAVPVPRHVGGEASSGRVEAALLHHAQASSSVRRKRSNEQRRATLCIEIGRCEMAM